MVIRLRSSDNWGNGGGVIQLLRLPVQQAEAVQGSLQADIERTMPT